MARVTITPVAVVGPHTTLQPAALALAFSLVPADATNKEQFAITGREILIAYNSGASARTITLTSVADDKNRTGDVTAYGIPAGGFCAYKFSSIEGWRQTDGYMYIEASHAEVKWAVLRY